MCSRSQNWYVAELCLYIEYPFFMNHNPCSLSFPSAACGNGDRGEVGIVEGSFRPPTE